tara:strand:- start:394 stop:525 length:132 start_codon:yes stop_codon:yes gene_type:complete
VAEPARAEVVEQPLPGVAEQVAQRVEVLVQAALQEVPVAQPEY